MKKHFLWGFALSVILPILIGGTAHANMTSVCFKFHRTQVNLAFIGTFPQGTSFYDRYDVQLGDILNYHVEVCEVARTPERAFTKALEYANQYIAESCPQGSLCVAVPY